MKNTTKKATALYIGAVLMYLLALILMFVYRNIGAVISLACLGSAIDSTWGSNTGLGLSLGMLIGLVLGMCLRKKAE